MDIHSSTGAPVYVINAVKTIIFLAENTDNHLRDAVTYDQATEEPNVAVFSKCDMTIFRDGSLTINGMYDDGIASKNGLIISGGNIPVNAADDGVRGKDYLILNDGTITVHAEGDGLKSDNEENQGRGFICIKDGVLHITSGMDAIQAATDVVIRYAECEISTGGGSRNNGYSGTSAKGIKAAGSVSIDDGIYMFNTADDAIHSNGTLFHIQSRDGNEILSFTPAKDFQSIAFSSVSLRKSTTCDVFIGGSSTGTLTDGLYLDGTYTPGTNDGS